MRRARCLAGRFLCVALASGEPAVRRRSRPAGSYHAGSSRYRRTLWQPAYPYRAAGPGPRSEPRPYRRSMRRHGIRASWQGRGGAPPTAVTTTRRSELAQPELQRGGPKPDLADRHHLCGTDRDGSIWPPSWICTAAGSSAGRWMIMRPSIGSPEHGDITRQPGANLIHHSDRGVQTHRATRAALQSPHPGLEAEGPTAMTMHRWKASSIRSPSGTPPPICNPRPGQSDIFLHRRLLIEHDVIPRSATTLRSRWS